MKTVTFYHSVLCPRCHVAGAFLDALIQEHPDVRVERVEYLTHLGRARRDGVRMIPTLVSGDRRVGGLFLSRASIRRFLETI
jgi:glutaredoxin